MNDEGFKKQFHKEQIEAISYAMCVCVCVCACVRVRVECTHHRSQVTHSCCSTCMAVSLLPPQQMAACYVYEIQCVFCVNEGLCTLFIVHVMSRPCDVPYQEVPPL